MALEWFVFFFYQGWQEKVENVCGKGNIVMALIQTKIDLIDQAVVQKYGNSAGSLLVWMSIKRECNGITDFNDRCQKLLFFELCFESSVRTRPTVWNLCPQFYCLFSWYKKYWWSLKIVDAKGWSSPCAPLRFHSLSGKSGKCWCFMKICVHSGDMARTWDPCPTLSRSHSELFAYP